MQTLPEQWLDWTLEPCNAFTPNPPRLKIKILFIKGEILIVRIIEAEDAAAQLGIQLHVRQIPHGTWSCLLGQKEQFGLLW